MGTKGAAMADRVGGKVEDELGIAAAAYWLRCEGAVAIKKPWLSIFGIWQEV